MTKDDYEYLKGLLEKTSKQVGLLSPDLWYANGDTVLTVARLLEKEDVLNSADITIDYFEKPWKAEYDMKELVKEYEDENEHTPIQVQA